MNLFVCLFNVAEPNPPQNLTVTAVKSNLIVVRWTAPDSTQNALFKQYILHWVDLSSGRGHSIRVDKTNQSAVIGGLKAYHAYKITVLTVTAQDVESNDSMSKTVITGRFCKKKRVGDTEG